MIIYRVYEEYIDSPEDNTDYGYYSTLELAYKKIHKIIIYLTEHRIITHIGQWDNDYLGVHFGSTYIRIDTIIVDKDII